MHKTYWPLIGLCLFVSYSCQSKSGNMEPIYKTELVETNKITLPIDENTYYLSRSMFHFEENGKEYLHFEHTEKRQYELIVFDLTEKAVSKRIPMTREGPNGILGVCGSRPYNSLNSFMLFQHNVGQLSLINDLGEILRKYQTWHPKGQFVYTEISSFIHWPSFVKDSIVYFHQMGIHPKMKKADWGKLNLFGSLDLRNGKFEWTPLFYPSSLFNCDVKEPAGGYFFSYDYNYKENRLVCAFLESDSLMVTDDLKNVKWYNGKSRYLNKMTPHIAEASEGIKYLKENIEGAAYHNIMYDKYRDVYYRIAELPCKLGEGEYPVGAIPPKAREFSVIIFNKDFRIIGETKFPGNKYFYKMSFIGRDGLYISENNEANPEFDENKLVFACFGLQDLKN